MAVKILSVDDEQDLELLLTQYFRRKIRKGEYEFFFAHNGIEALQTLLAHPDVDIVLSDINMPEMDGLTLLKKLKDRNNPALKVIMVSAYGEMGNIRTAMNNGAFDFAMKPIDLDDLQLTIEKAITEIDFIKSTQEEHTQLVDIKGDLALAAEIQLAILPHTFPPQSPFQAYAGKANMHATMKPAKDVGGDFYDVYPIDEEHLGFCIADVSGKGVPAALFMAVSHTLLRFAGKSSIEPTTVIADSNTILATESFDSMFVTLFYGVYNTTTGEISYVNAGHNAPYILRQDGEVEELPYSSNICLGIIPDIPFQASSATLNPGDAIVTFTDGVTEAFAADGELFGEKRLESLIGTLTGKPAEEITAAINTAVQKHAEGAEQSDDITCLVLKRL